MNMSPAFRSRLVRAASVALLLLANQAVPAIDLLPDFDLFGDDGEGKTVWEIKDQFVRIVPQDEDSSGKTEPNDHPVQLDGKELRQALGAIQMWDRAANSGAGDVGPFIFDPSQIGVLEGKLVAALSRAESGEDVTFAVIGRQRSGMFAGERTANAGRAFFKAGKLNIIFGDVLREVEGKKKIVSAAVGVVEEDRRLYPFKVGTRRKAQDHDWRIATQPGIEFHDAGGGAKRDDWLIIDIPVVIANLNKKAVPEVVAKEAQKVRDEAAKLAAERRQMREEMARMRKEMQGRDGGEAAESTEDRLARLDRLREKQLISDDEYERKRKEILDDI